MANNFKLKLGGDFEKALSAYGKKVEERVLLSGAAAMARLIYEEVKLNASPPRMGKKSGNLEKSIYRVYSKDRSLPTRKLYAISWNKRTAPHGHLLEFGTSRAAAKPFVSPAAAHLKASVDAGRARMTEVLANGVIEVSE